MSLRVALVIDGDQAGAKKALDDTAAGIGKVEEAAGKAGGPVKQLPEALKDTATEAGNAKDAVGDLGGAAEGVGVKFGNLKTLAIGAIGGIAGALATAALEWAADAALGAVVDYFDEVTNSATNIKADLEAHKDLIGGVKDLWDEAAGAASSYGANSKPLLQFEAAQNIERLSGDLDSELGRVGGIDYVSNPNRLGNSLVDGKLIDHPLEDTLRGLREDLADGRADIIAWRDEIVSIANETPIGSSSRDIAADFIEQTRTAVELQAELERGVDVYRALTGDAAAAATAMGEAADKAGASGEAAAGALPALQAYADLLATISRGEVTPSFTPVPGTGFSGGGAPGTIGGSFAGGGPTGDGAVDEIAGVVHRREFVFDAAATARIGVGNLEALRKGGLPGYASGGYVGGYSIGAYEGDTGTIGGAIARELAPLHGIMADLVIAATKSKNVWDTIGGYAERLYEGVLSSALGAIENAFLGQGGFGGGGGGGDIFGSIFGAIFGGGPQLQLGYQAGVLHGGGNVGRAPASRFVPAGLFDNAPRLHGGGSLRAGERPIIALEGEDVGFPDQLASKYGGKVEVHVHPTAGQTATVRESDNGRGGRRLDVVMNEAVGQAIATPRGPAQQAMANAGAVVRR